MKRRNNTKHKSRGESQPTINGNLASNLEYKPSFISNNPEEGKKVISSIEEELLRCEQFQISVAFITKSKIHPPADVKRTRAKGESRGKFLQRTT